MKKELKHLIDKKVIKVEINTIIFDDGTEIEFHPYETYVYRPNVESN